MSARQTDLGHFGDIFLANHLIAVKKAWSSKPITWLELETKSNCNQDTTQKNHKQLLRYAKN